MSTYGSVGALGRVIPQGHPVERDDDDGRTNLRSRLFDHDQLDADRLSIECIESCCSFSKDRNGLHFLSIASVAALEYPAVQDVRSATDAMVGESRGKRERVLNRIVPVLMRLMARGDVAREDAPEYNADDMQTTSTSTSTAMLSRRVREVAVRTKGCGGDIEAGRGCLQVFARPTDPGRRYGSGPSLGTVDLVVVYDLAISRRASAPLMNAKPDANALWLIE